jgi:hypothetical protein
VAKKQEMGRKIEEVDTLYRQNMEKLQEDYQERRKIKNLQSVGEM